jgi:hypothetical protein
MTGRTRQLAIILAAIVLFCGAYVLAHWALIEVGREVVVVRTENADGTWRQTRLWIVDDGDISWLHSNRTTRWMQNVMERPIVEVVRGGETRRYRATLVPGPHARLHELMRQKYGVADWWVRLVGSDGEFTVPVRLERLP